MTSHVLPASRDFSLDSLRFKGPDISTMRPRFDEILQATQAYNDHTYRVVYRGEHHLRDITLIRVDGNHWRVTLAFDLPWESRPQGDNYETKVDCLAGLGPAPKFHFVAELPTDLPGLSALMPRLAYLVVPSGDED